uniref:Putative secreted protein n=1 Tax=Xenopsylla cheopis TaxID=163159 RepID=A0A6M2DZY2_XENCH
MHLKTKILFLSIFIFINTVLAYDPEDKKLETVLPAKGTFEAFYPKGEPRGSARASHYHGSFFKYRNPALIGAKNAAAYGYRFDGGRRFNFD